MFKKILIIIVAFLIHSQVTSQSFVDSNKDRRKNSVYVEILGSAGYLYNISYDRLVYSKGKNHVSTAIGFQYLPSNLSSMIDADLVTVSPQISYLYGISNHLEIGVGTLHHFGSNQMAFSSRIGFRLQKPNGGTFVKLALTPIFLSGFTPITSFGLSIGWTF